MGHFSSTVCCNVSPWLYRTMVFTPDDRTLIGNRHRGDDLEPTQHGVLHSVIPGMISPFLYLYTSFNHEFLPFTGTMLIYSRRNDRVIAPIILTAGIPNYQFYRTNPDISLNVGVVCSTPANLYPVHPGDNRNFRPFPIQARPSLKTRKMLENWLGPISWCRSQNWSTLNSHIYPILLNTCTITYSNKLCLVARVLD